MLVAENISLSCDCSGCKATEEMQNEANLPYRYLSSPRLNIFNYTLILLISIIGVQFIGFSLWALIPIGSLIMAYLFLSFFFCATCSYHHENLKFCGKFNLFLRTTIKQNPKN